MAPTHATAGVAGSLVASQRSAGNRAVSSLIASGQPLDPATGYTMKQRFGTDFGAVRVHTGDMATRAADSEFARAYTLGIWPKETPVASDVDAAWLAGRFLLSGGNIRVAVAAAYFAAEDGGALLLEHVLRAVRAKFQKMGKTMTAAELAPAASAASGVAA